MPRSPNWSPPVVTYSGLTVFMAMLVLSVMLYDIMIVRSISLGVMLVAIMALAAGLTLLKGGGTARLWATNVVPAANNVTVTRATNGVSYTLAFPQATFTGQNLQALVIFLTGSGLPLEPDNGLCVPAERSV